MEIDRWWDVVHVLLSSFLSFYFLGKIDTKFVNSLIFAFILTLKRFPIPPGSSPYSVPNENEGRSPLWLRLQRQDPLAFATLLLVSGPVPLLALRATVAGDLAATTDIELPKPPFN